MSSSILSVVGWRLSVYWSTSARPLLSNPHWSLMTTIDAKLGDWFTDSFQVTQRNCFSVVANCLWSRSAQTAVIVTVCWWRSDERQITTPCAHQPLLQWCRQWQKWPFQLVDGSRLLSVCCWPSLSRKKSGKSIRKWKKRLRRFDCWLAFSVTLNGDKDCRIALKCFWQSDSAMSAKLRQCTKKLWRFEWKSGQRMIYFEYQLTITVSRHWGYDSIAKRSPSPPPDVMWMIGLFWYYYVH